MKLQINSITQDELRMSVPANGRCSRIMGVGDQIILNSVHIFPGIHWRRPGAERETALVYDASLEISIQDRIELTLNILHAMDEYTKVQAIDDLLGLSHIGNMVVILTEKLQEKTDDTILAAINELLTLATRLHAFDGSENLKQKLSLPELVELQLRNNSAADIEVLIKCSKIREIS